MEKAASNKWWILTAMCLLTVMLNIDVTAINIAVPVIAHEFHASLANMQWVINAYVLLSAMFQILGGRFGDTYGHKKIFLIGTIIFILGSAGAGISENETMLIFFRVVQGFALGIAYPMTIVLTFAAFSKKEQGFALSFIVGTMGVSLAFGPPLGGWIVDTIGWRWIFYINVPIGIITCIIAWIYCKAHKASEKRAIDYKGALFLILALFGIVLALNQAQVWGLTSAAFLTCFFAGVLLTYILYLVERKQTYPIIDFRLFKIRNLWINNLLRIIAQLVFIPVIFFVPLYLQNIAGTSAIFSGLVMLFLTVIIGILSPIAGKWVDKVGDKLPNIYAMILYLIACYLLTFITPEPNLWILAISLFLIGVATSIAFVTTVTGSVTVTKEKDHGLATGIIFTIGWLGCALGIALMGTIVSLSSDSYLNHHLEKMEMTLSPEESVLVQRVSKGVSSYTLLPQEFSGDELTDITNLTKDSFVYGFRVSMWIWMALSALGILLSICLKKHRMKPHEEISSF